MENAMFVPAGGGETQHILGMTHVNKVLPGDTRGAFTIIEIIIPPGLGAPMHRHQRDAECFYMLDGELTFETPDGAVTGRAGDTYFLPVGGRHAFRNDGETEARALVFVTPGAEAARFFAELDAGGAALGPADVEALAAQNGIVFA